MGDPWWWPWWCWRIESGWLAEGDAVLVVVVVVAVVVGSLAVEVLAACLLRIHRSECRRAVEGEVGRRGLVAPHPSSIHCGGGDGLLVQQMAVQFGHRCRRIEQTGWREVGHGELEGGRVHQGGDAGSREEGRRRRWLRVVEGKRQRRGRDSRRRGRKNRMERRQRRGGGRGRDDVTTWMMVE